MIDINKKDEMISTTKMILQRPKVIPKTSRLKKPVSNILRYTDSHIWGSRGPHHRLETTQNTPCTSTFFLAWFLIVKIRLCWPKVMNESTHFHKSIFSILRNPHMGAPWASIRAQKPTPPPKRICLTLPNFPFNCSRWLKSCGIGPKLYL